jgi:general stress protein YciG
MQRNENEINDTQKSERGFASMNADLRRTIASSGGRAAHQQGVAHEWNREEAQMAGKKGGQISGRNKKPGRNGTMPQAMEE